MEPRVNNESGRSFGVVGLVMGIIAIILSIIPFLGLIAIVPGFVALIFSIIGYIQASKSESQKGLIIAALVLSTLSVGFSGFQYYSFRFLKDDIKSIANDLSDTFDNNSDLEKEEISNLEDALKELESGEQDDSTLKDVINSVKINKYSQIEFDAALKEIDDILFEIEKITEKSENDLSLAERTMVATKSARIIAKIISIAPNLNNEQEKKLEQVLKKHEKTMKNFNININHTKDQSMLNGWFKNFVIFNLKAENTTEV